MSGAGTRPMVPGGETDSVRRAGGEQLYRQVQTLVGGHRVDVVLYALTEAMASLLLVVAETPEEAERLAGSVRGDVINSVRLNWDSDARRRARLQLLSGTTTETRQ